MKFNCAGVLLALVVLDSLSIAGRERQSKPESSYVAVHKYDPSRDATIDIDRAVAEAMKTGKRVLVEVGGDWCPYCHALDQFFQQHPDVLQLSETNFITVDVYYGPDNKNQQPLSRYSKVLGIPHFFVLDEKGSLLHSQHVIELKTDGNYSADKVKEFLNKWSNHGK